MNSRQETVGNVIVSCILMLLMLLFGELIHLIASNIQLLFNGLF